VWRDLAIRHRQTEAAPILGALVDAATRAGQTVPRVRALLKILQDLETDRRQMDWANLDEMGAAT
jgi:ketopantoate reductase